MRSLPALAAITALLVQTPYATASRPQAMAKTRPGVMVGAFLRCARAVGDSLGGRREQPSPAPLPGRNRGAGYAKTVSAAQQLAAPVCLVLKRAGRVSRGRQTRERAPPRRRRRAASAG